MLPIGILIVVVLAVFVLYNGLVRLKVQADSIAKF
jgi:hypothetical protein